MKLLSNLNRLPEGARLSLFARLQGGQPEWRHVGWLTRQGHGFEIDWTRGAGQVAAVWPVAGQEGGPVERVYGVVEFGAAGPGGVPVRIASAQVTHEVLRGTLRPIEPGQRRPPVHGGPQKPRSAWPAESRLATRGSGR